MEYAKPYIKPIHHSPNTSFNTPFDTSFNCSCSSYHNGKIENSFDNFDCSFSNRNPTKKRIKKIKARKEKEEHDRYYSRICSGNKIGYRSEKEAKKELRKEMKYNCSVRRVYFCKECKKWHLTSEE